MVQVIRSSKDNRARRGHQTSGVSWGRHCRLLLDAHELIAAIIPALWRFRRAIAVS
jgi:hypothetical protein